jgi:DNA-binding CsgD family transcriptional regulator
MEIKKEPRKTIDLKTDTKQMMDLFEAKNRTLLQNESITSLFFNNIPATLNKYEEISESQIETFKLISTITNGSVYVTDFHKQCFLFVSNHDLFLSGFSPDDVLKMGYDFFSKIVHPNDLQLFIDIHCAILHYLSESDSEQQEIDYFAFNIRLLNHGLPLMVYHKMTPVFIHGFARMAVCHLSSSVIHKSGNLEIYFIDRKKRSSYSFKKQQWQSQEQLRLTNREKDILKLARQGKCNKEIADILHVSEKTIRNIETTLYEKLNVHSMCEAIIYATNHRMIFV